MIIKIDGDLFHKIEHHKWEYGTETTEIDIPKILLLKYYMLEKNEKLRKKYPDFNIFLKKYKLSDTYDLVYYLTETRWLTPEIITERVEHEGSTKRKTENANKFYSDKIKDYLFYMANNVKADYYDIKYTKKMRAFLPLYVL